MAGKSAELVAFGRNVRRRRRALGLTQEDLAGELGFSAPYLSEIESGRRDIGLTRLMALAKALAVTLDELVTGSTAGHSGPPDAVQSLALRINDLPRKRQSAAIEILTALKKIDD